MRGKHLRLRLEGLAEDDKAGGGKALEEAPWPQRSLKMIAGQRPTAGRAGSRGEFHPDRFCTHHSGAFLLIAGQFEIFVGYGPEMGVQDGWGRTGGVRWMRDRGIVEGENGFG